MPRYFTTREVGDICDQPEWLIRRVADELDPPVSRFGHKRMIPADRVSEIKERLSQRHRRNRPEAATQ